jgi:hypothetical protein
MLKIKDSVDLKELEKFGFEYNKLLDEYVIDIATDRRGACVELVIDKDKKIRLVFGGQDTGDVGEDYIDDAIYDLIKADMVVKIDD